MAGWRGLEAAVKAGKVRAIGLSNFDLNEKLFDDVLAKAEIKPAIVQIELHPYAQRKAFREKCAKNYIVVEGWYPLGGTHGGNSVLFADPVINEIAGRYEITQNPNRFEMIETNVSPITEFGIGFAKGNTELRDKVQVVFDEMIRDGTAKKISEKWFHADLIKLKRYN